MTNITTITEAQAKTMRLKPVTIEYDLQSALQRTWKARVEADLARDPAIQIFNVRGEGHPPHLLSVWRSKPRAIKVLY